MLNDSYLVALVDELMQILVQSFLWKSNMQLFAVAHPIEVEQFVTQDGIHVEDLVKLAKFEKENLFKVVLLQLPVLGHARCECLPIGRRDV